MSQVKKHQSRRQPITEKHCCPKCKSEARYYHERGKEWCYWIVTCLDCNTEYSVATGEEY